MELRTYLLVLWRKRCLLLAAFLSTVLATSVLTFLQKPTYKATSTFVISPTGTYRDAQSLAGVLDTMSRRPELSNTYAEIASSRSVKQDVVAKLGLSDSQRKDLRVDAKLLPETNVLEISVQGSDAQLVWLFASEVGATVADYTRTLYEAYGLQPLDMPVVPTSPVDPNRMLNLALGTALGLALGVGLAFVANYLEMLRKQASGQSEPEAQSGTPGQDVVAAPQPALLRAVSWGVVALLTLGVVVMGSVLFLWEPRTSASVLPGPRPVVTFVPASVWTPTPTMMPAEATLLASSPTPEAEVIPTPCSYPPGWVVYEVQVEDTLSSLAKTFDMSVAEIVDANCLTRRVITAGQLLYFPPGPATATPAPAITGTEGMNITTENAGAVTEGVTITAENVSAITEGVTLTTELSPTGCIPPDGWTTLHVVQTGDNLYSLALTHGVSVEEIVAANCLESTFLSAGHQQLYLPPPLEGISFPATTSSQAARSTPLPARAAGPSLPAPILSAPADGAEFPADGEILLTWQPVPGLPTDAYYVVTVAYSHNGETWYDDVPWTRNTTWRLSDHGYLLNLSDDGRFVWSVQVARQTGAGDGGSPQGEPLSETSSRRMVIWQLPSTGGSRPQNGTPSAPPP